MTELQRHAQQSPIEKHTVIQKNDLPTILAVDDSIVMQTLIKRVLDGYCRVLVVSNATDALKLIYRENILLLLLDVSMPDIDGLELCRTLRSISRFCNLPVIMLSGGDNVFDKIEAEKAGSTEYLTKPLDAQKLRQIIGKYVGEGR